MMKKALILSFDAGMGVNLKGICGSVDKLFASGDGYDRLPPLAGFIRLSDAH